MMVETPLGKGYDYKNKQLGEHPTFPGLASAAAFRMVRVIELRCTPSCFLGLTKRLHAPFPCCISYCYVIK